MDILSRPIITVREWAAQQSPSIPERTALNWAKSGHLPAYQSPPDSGIWLVLSAQPSPGRPMGNYGKRRKTPLM